MAWWNAIFSSKKIVNSAVDLIDTTVRSTGTWINDLKLTDEEKVKYQIKILDKHIQFVEASFQESLPRAISRRILAWGIMLLWAISFLAYVAAGIWAPHAAEIILDGVDKFYVGSIALSVAAFYFGGFYLPKLFRRWKDAKYED